MDATILPPPWAVYWLTLVIFTAVGGVLGAVAGHGLDDHSPALSVAVMFLVLAISTFTPVWVAWEIASYFAN